LHGDADNITDAFLQIPRRQLVILGSPGAGKSVLSMLLTLGLLDRAGPGEPVPVLMTLSSWDPKREHLWSWMARRISEDYSGLAKASQYGKNAPAQLIATGRIFPVLDGLDEISPELVSAAIDGIDSAISSGVPAVVTCRSQEYETAVMTGGQMLTAAAVVEIEPVRPDDVISYISHSALPGTGQWRSVFARLASEPTGPLAQALSTPLMVWLVRTIYTQPGSQPVELIDPDRFPDAISIENHLLDALIPALYADRPNSPGARAKHMYRASQASHWLTLLARYSMNTQSNKVGLSTGGQSTDLAWWDLYRLIPRAQRGLCVLLYSIPFAIIPTGLVVWLTLGFTERRIVNLLVVGSIGIAAAAIDSMFFHPPPPGRVQIQRPEASYLFKAIKTSLAFGLIVGATVGSAAGIVISISSGPATALKSGAISGFIAGLTIVLIGMLNGPVDTVQAASPGSVLRQDRVVAVMTALLTGLDNGIIVGIASGPWIGLSASIPFATTLGLGMTSWGWFCFTRIWLGIRGVIPIRLMSFWDDAHRRGILRQVGAVYQFRHARLQERLARK
jgi:hypothetical protein